MQPKEKPHFARPHAGRDVKALERAVEGDDAPLAPVVERHLEAARGGDDKLVALLVGVRAAAGPGGDVVQIEDAAHGKGDVHAGVHAREVALGVMVPGQRDEGAVGHGHSASDMFRAAAHRLNSS